MHGTYMKSRGAGWSSPEQCGCLIYTGLTWCCWPRRVGALNKFICGARGSTTAVPRLEAGHLGSAIHSKVPPVG